MRKQFIDSQIKESLRGTKSDNKSRARNNTSVTTSKDMGRTEGQEFMVASINGRIIEKILWE